MNACRHAVRIATRCHFYNSLDTSALSHRLASNRMSLPKKQRKGLKPLRQRVLCSIAINDCLSHVFFANRLLVVRDSSEHAPPDSIMSLNLSNMPSAPPTLHTRVVRQLLHDSLRITSENTLRDQRLLILLSGSESTRILTTADKMKSCQRTPKLLRQQVKHAQMTDKGCNMGMTVVLSKSGETDHLWWNMLQVTFPDPHRIDSKLELTRTT